MRTLRVFACILGVGLATSSACRCDKTPTEHPSTRIPNTVEMVLEIPDIANIARAKDALLSLAKGVASDAETQEAAASLKRVVGFDVLTSEGRKAAGFRDAGPVSIGVVNDQDGVMVVIPIGDTEKLTATIESALRDHVSYDEKKVEKIAHASVTVFLRTEGTEKIPVAAMTPDGGFMIVAIGRASLDAVKSILAITKTDNVTSHPEYQAHANKLTPNTLLRAVVPQAKILAEKAASATRHAIPADASFVRSLVSVGWTLAISEKAMTLDGKLRLDDGGRARVASVFKEQGPTPGGVRAALLGGPALTLSAEGDAQALFEAIRPTEPASREHFDRELGDLAATTGVDFQKDILPSLTGHAVIAFGIGDLSIFRDGGMEAFLRQPARVLWTMASAGMRATESTQSLVAFAMVKDELMKAQSLTKRSQKVGETDVTQIVRLGDGEKNESVMLASAFKDNAWLMANSSTELERRLRESPATNAGARDIEPGACLTLDINRIRDAVVKLDLVSTMAGAERMLLGGLIEKVMRVFERFDRLEARVAPTTDGLLGSLSLSFHPAAAAPASSAQP